MSNTVGIKVQADADTSGLQQTGDALERVGNEADNAGKKASFFAESLKADLTARATEHLISFATETISLADKLADLSARAGTTAENFQLIGNAAADNGSSLETASEALAELTIRAQQAVAGNKTLAEGFSNLGFTIDDLKNSSPDELFFAISDAVSENDDKSKALADTNVVLGDKAKQLFATLNLGSEEVKKLSESFGILSNESVKSLDEVDQSLQKFQGNIKSSIAVALGGWNDFTEKIANKLFGISEEQAKAFDEMEANAKDAAAGVKAGMDDAAGSVKGVGTAADLASAKLALIDNAFAQRSLGELSPENKLEVIRQKIEELRESASKEFDIKFGNAADLNTIANGLGENALKAKELASELAQLEDAEKKAKEEADKKSDADKKGADALTEKANAARNAANALREQASGEAEALKVELQRLQGEFHQTTDVRNRQADIQNKLFELDGTAPKTLTSPSVLPNANTLSQTPQVDTTEIAAGMEQVSGSISELGAAITEGLDGITGAIGEVNGNITSQFADVSKSVSGISDAVGSGVEGIQGAIASVIQDITRRLSIAEQQIANLR